MNLAVDELSQPLSEDLPCGDDLEYDDVFALMETAMQWQEGQEFGDTKTEAQPPDWSTVRQHAMDLAERTRDLRILVNLSIALLNEQGFPGFHQALQLLNACMDQHWDTIHPQLDPDDDNDPMMRMNVLQNLDDYPNVHQGIRKSPLVELKGVGAFSLQDIERARGASDPDEESDEEVIDIAIITGAFSDADPDVLFATAEALNGSREELERLLEIWSDKSDGYEAPGVSGALKALKDVQKVFADFAPAGSVEAEASMEEGGEAAVATVPGAINNTKDVILAIERICDYYAANEPSSPIPLILNRAKRLVSKDFYEILRDVAPEGISQFDNLSGRSDD